VAARSAVVRAGLQTVLHSAPDLEVITSQSGADGLVPIDAPDVDVLLVDLDRGGEAAVPRLSALSAAGNAPALVVLTGPEGLSAAAALRLGARAVLAREAETEEIVAAVRAAAAGLVVLSSAAVESILPHLPTAGTESSSVHAEDLTPREIEVLAMLAEGAGNKLIARRLGISEHTVKFHVGSILGKLSASSRTEAVTIGIRQGLILV
jgi:DNA-binding NarL/FixJ family response regulator